MKEFLQISKINKLERGNSFVFPGRLYKLYVRQSKLAEKKFTVILSFAGSGIFKTSDYTTLLINGEEYAELKIFANDDDFFPLDLMGALLHNVRAMITYESGRSEILNDVDLYGLVELTDKFPWTLPSNRIVHTYHFHDGHQVKLVFILGLVGVVDAEEVEWVYND
jgi:hypothetical protein